MPGRDSKLKDYCISWLADLLSLPPDRVSEQASFASLGLDSANSVRFILDLEDYLGKELQPEVISEYDNIHKLVGYLQKFIHDN